MDKKGLSDIITNVLIILLVLVAITIIWFFIKPTIERGAGQLPGAGDCITLRLEPQRCAGATSGSVVIGGTTVTCTSSSNGFNCYDVLVKRSSGEAKIKGVQFVFELADKTTIVTNSTRVINEGDALIYKLAMPQRISAQSVRVAGIIEDSTDGKICSLGSQLPCLAA